MVGKISLGTNDQLSPKCTLNSHNKATTEFVSALMIISATSTITRIEILILCTILLCSMQHILIQKPQKSHFDFWPTKNQQQTLP